MTGTEGPLKVCGSQASDSKEALCGREPTNLLAGSMSSFIVFYCFQKDQKHKKKLGETIR